MMRNAPSHKLEAGRQLHAASVEEGRLPLSSPHYVEDARAPHVCSNPIEPKASNDYTATDHHLYPDG